MGAGAYLGARAESEVVRGELLRLRAEAFKQPYMIQEGLLEELTKEGLGRDAAYRVVQLLGGSPQALVSTAEAKMFGLGGKMLGNAALDGLVMGTAFILGAVIPLLPYMLITVPKYDLGGALVATAVALFTVGYFEGWLAHRSDRWRSGIQFLAIAMTAAAAGYLIGLAISPLGATAG
jgi:VIT1/CCC1 family predicted Fe2+/Mn2+ transporter